MRSFGSWTLAGVLLLWPQTAGAQSAADMYNQTLAQETTLRGDATPALAAIRRLVSAYESIVDRFPTSGYCDNALWQAAGLEALAFEKFADLADRRRAGQFLEWLQKEYSSSPFVKQAAALAAQLQQAPVKAADPPVSSSTELTPASRNGPPAQVRSVTRTALPRGDRITIEFSREVSYKGDRIPGPDRIYFDFQNAVAAGAAADKANLPAGTLVKAARVGAHDATTTRLVLELGGAPRFSVFPLYDPFRLVIDVETEAPAPAASQPPSPAPSAAPAFSVVPLPEPPQPPASRPPAKPPADAPAGPAAATSRGDYSIARQLGLSVSRVVIDPGHGGHDPGAQANGIDEAELVLDVALRLEKLLLDQPGFEVVLTRRTDDFIPLEERTALANRENADLFLSIHANASRESTARGIETYFLNFAATPAAEAVAARENASSQKTMANLGDLVKSITLNDKVTESHELASMVQASLVKRLTTTSAAARDLGVKQAPFVVLIGAQMPSVLAEISFLTNRTDASLLKQDAYRQRIAQALCDALVGYRAALKKPAVTAKVNGK